MLLCIQAFKLKSYKWMDGMGMESILWMDAPLLRALIIKLQQFINPTICRKRTRCVVFKKK